MLKESRDHSNNVNVYFEICCCSFVNIGYFMCSDLFICQIKVSIGKTNEQNLSLLTATQWFCFVKFCANVDVGLFNEANEA